MTACKHAQHALEPEVKNVSRARWIQHCRRVPVSQDSA